MAGKVFGEGGYSWRILCCNGIAEAYLKSSQASSAGKYIHDVALIYEKAKKNIDPALFVNFYTNSYKYNPANGHYPAAFRNAKIPIYRGLLGTFYNNSYEYDVATGDYRAAILALQRYLKWQNSFLTLDRDNKVAELEIQYQTAEKEQAIKFLHSQSAVQQARVENADLQKNITIGGILVMILVSALFYRNYNLKQAANNTMSQKNALLQRHLTENEWLLKEVHHRVKNNLHTVICLLESQARYLENDALKAIETSQHRLYAMSLIHQKLYQSEDIKAIAMATYIPELIQSLIDGFGTAGKINFRLNIEPIELGLSHAIPLALIINEAVTNSIKYAFPDKERGDVFISLAKNVAHITLIVADNGIGMPQFNANRESDSLGIRLIKGLSDDIDAEISFEVAHGTEITITFKSDPLNNPDSSFIAATKSEVGYA
jgi:two-component sensor histidine kinase